MHLGTFLSVALALALGLALAPAPDLRTETWPGGSKKAEYEVELDEQGLERKHGAFRSFFEDGTSEAEGAFEHGKESGAWVLHHPNGARAAAGAFADGLKSGPWETFFADGTPESKGGYVRGAMDGRWTFWRADGTKDLVASGLYKLEVARTKDGRHTRGYFVDGKRQGAWTSYWPDRSVQLEGQYLAGQRTGEWLFRHADGTPSALLVTGRYTDGEWSDRLELPEPPPLDPARLAAPEPAPGGWPRQRAALDTALRTAVQARAIAHELGATLDAIGLSALPVVLEHVRMLDPESAKDRAALGFLEDQVLRRLCAGRALSHHGLAGPPDAASARELVRAWLSLWAVTRSDAHFWNAAVPGPSRPGGGLRDLLQDPPVFERGEASPASEAAVATPEVRSEYRLRFGKAKEEALRLAPPGTQEAVARALRWLAAHQQSDGGWSCAGFASECGKIGPEPCSGKGPETHDVGATGLALLCFLGDGHTTELGAYREVVRRGLDWLVRKQDDTGLIGARVTHDFLYDHALGTTALCEGLGLGAEGLRAPAERALAFLLSARHPEGAWRYDLPPTEPGDTSITGWAVNALVAAVHAGLTVPDEALAAGARWVERLTDPESGRVGYIDAGGLSARTPANEEYPREMGEAMTAAGLLIRLQLGQRPARTPALHAHARLLAVKPPVLDKRFGGDQYYWYLATSALHQLGGTYWNAWEPDLRKSVIAGQAKRGDAEGSWDAIGPWAFASGRVVSTALMTLALESFTRHPRLTADGK